MRRGKSNPMTTMAVYSLRNLIIPLLRSHGVIWLVIQAHFSVNDIIHRDVYSCTAVVNAHSRVM